MDIISLTGWGQRADSLGSVFKELGNIESMDYRPFASGNAFIAEMAVKRQRCDILIGWSLGAQLAVRLVAAGALKPKLLVLLAPPFRYVGPKGVSSIAFQLFYKAFCAFPPGAMQRFAAQIGIGDRDAEKIVQTLHIDEANHESWKSWLKELAVFDCKSLAFKGFPPSLVIHGLQDAVTPFFQSQLFKENLPNCRLELVTQCGHAPHLHDPESVRQWIKQEYCRVST